MQVISVLIGPVQQKQRIAEIFRSAKYFGKMCLSVVQGSGLLSLVLNMWNKATRQPAEQHPPPCNEQQSGPSTNMAALPQNDSLLLALPAEIRELIYIRLLQSMHIDLNRWKVKPALRDLPVGSPWIDWDTSPTPQPLGVLFACRKLYTELRPLAVKHLPVTITREYGYPLSLYSLDYRHLQNVTLLRAQGTMLSASDVDRILLQLPQLETIERVTRAGTGLTECICPSSAFWVSSSPMSAALPFSEFGEPAYLAQITTLFLPPVQKYSTFNVSEHGIRSLQNLFNFSVRQTADLARVKKPLNFRVYINLMCRPRTSEEKDNCRKSHAVRPLAVLASASG